MSLDIELLRDLEIDPVTGKVFPCRPKPAGKRRRPRFKAEHVTAFLVRATLVRALRRAGLHDMVVGGPGVVCLVLSDNFDSSLVARGVLELLRGHDRDARAADYRVMDWISPRRKGVSGWEEWFADGEGRETRLVAMADAGTDLPPSFVALADGIVDLPRPDAALVAAAFKAFVGKVPARLPDDATLRDVPLSAYGFAVARGVAPDRCVERLLRLAEAFRAERATQAGGVKEDDGPSLTELHGLGEATDWGRQLAVDLTDYKASRIGWRDVDRGVLLSGPPGTGKTTFARALGKTCDVPVFVHSLARWQAAGYLNDLLKSMRGAFAEARAAAPSILFVDELDSFGDRAKLEGKNRQYSVEVINGFLECLDGADRRQGVVVVGATNDPENVDPAIKRAGRLDRHVEIGLPDAAARAGILRHHLGEDLQGADLGELVLALEGMSGADLEQAVRSARRLARTARRLMTLDDLVGGLPKGVALSGASFERACWHEASHLVVGALLARETGTVPVEARVSRTAHGAEGGRTSFSRDQGFARTREAYLAEIAVYVSGIAGERLRFESNGHGAGGTKGSDLHCATGLAIAIEASLGLGDRLAYAGELGSEALFAHMHRDPALRSTVEATLQSCLERATDLLGRHRPALEAVVRILESQGIATLSQAVGALPPEVPAPPRMDSEKNLQGPPGQGDSEPQTP